MRLPGPRFYVTLDKKKIVVRDAHGKQRDEEYNATTAGSEMAHRRAKVLNECWEKGAMPG